jgi:hypothetical protein
LPMFRECEGFATRTFTVSKADEELIVTGMSGPQKRRRAADLSVRQ